MKTRTFFVLVAVGMVLILIPPLLRTVAAPARDGAGE